jgi:hypothetical protein
MRIPRVSYDGRFLILALVASLATAAVARAGELTEAEFLSAQHSAAEQKKPIFIWAMDGHPLGCT